MRFATARQAWHDAYDYQSAESDYAAMASGKTDRSRTKRQIYDTIIDDDGRIIASAPVPTTCAVETRVGRGSSARIMDACEKGMVQSAVGKIRRSDPLAYCWGMAAYAPPASRVTERAALLQHLMGEFDSWGESHDRTKVGQLAFFCIQACALRDVNGRHVDLRQARIILSVDKVEWDRDWKKIWQRLQRRLDPLPGRALGPVAELVEDYQERCRAAS
jgi:hypothetical protein